LSYRIRLMRKEDVDQVSEIDREAFPTQLPPPNYQYELRNRLAHYMVAYQEEGEIADVPQEPVAPKESNGGISLWRRLLGGNNSREQVALDYGQQSIVGFVGLWIIADEAHIISIATREVLRRNGIGELLLIAAIELAAELKAHAVTLEVRVSNTDAQHLYTKYGFTQAGVRYGYYVDNREDGLIMTTERVTSATYKARFQRLKRLYARKWGIAPGEIAR